MTSIITSQQIGKEMIKTDIYNDVVIILDI